MIPDKNLTKQEKFEMRQTLIDAFCLYEEKLAKINKDIEELQSGVNS